MGAKRWCEVQHLGAMTWTLPITGEYPPDWPAINAAVCEAVGHRCIRCLHPYKKGAHGKGEWSPCDFTCRHDGPFGALKPYVAGFYAMKYENRNLTREEVMNDLSRLLELERIA